MNFAYSGTGAVYEGLSHTFMANMQGADDDTPTGHGTLSDDIKISYADDELNGAIFYPSGASVGKEGFDE